MKRALMKLMLAVSVLCTSQAEAGIVGDRDERLQGSYAALSARHGTQISRHFLRTLRISSPLPGSGVATGTPICFRDTILTVAHIARLRGNLSFSPLRLQASVPHLGQPGQFVEHRTVSDYQPKRDRRSSAADQASAAADDFLLLKLARPLPDWVQPLALPPLHELRNVSSPLRCAMPTINAAYHDDLGVLDSNGQPEKTGTVQARLRYTGQVPLLTYASVFPPKDEDPSLFGGWYQEPLIALTSHDTQEAASGSAIVCPQVTNGSTESLARQTDTLLGLVIGHTVVQTRRIRSMRNVITINLPGIYTALARLKGLAVNELETVCRTIH